MTEKSKAQFLGMKPVPMKLFATWEDRTPSNCIPRLCSLTLTRLILMKPLLSDVSTVIIAVKMQGSKKTLRSNELQLSANGLLDTELELSFSLQYPHFLKRDGNRLHVMLQRRKRYKNRTILGYKTLAEGVVNMSQVLQRQMEMDLELLGDCKEAKAPVVVGRVSIFALNSQPVDHEDTNKTLVGRDFSDEDEDYSSGNDVDVEGSDSEPMAEERRCNRKKKLNGNVQQRNLKQKFISLLKIFRANEDLQSLDNDQETISRKLSGEAMVLEDLFDELEDISDSGPEVDTMSITSTPKPSLRPFFASSRSLLLDGLNVPGRSSHKKICNTSKSATHAPDRNLERVSDESSKKADSDSHPDNWTDSDPPPTHAGIIEESGGNNNGNGGKKEGEKEKKTRLFQRGDKNNSSSGKSKKGQQQQQQQASTPQQDGGASKDFAAENNNLEFRRSVTDQLNKLLPPEEGVPEMVCLVNGGDAIGAKFAAALQQNRYKVIALMNSQDTRMFLACLVNKMQKFCNTSPKPSPQVKLLLAGTDSFINIVLRHYVDQLSFKPSDWIMFIKFYIVPLGFSSLCRYVASVDNIYASSFANESWKEAIESGDGEEVNSRLQMYLRQATATLQFPVAEAMLTCKDKSSTEESSQIFIPFLSEVRIGNIGDFFNTSMDGALEEGQSGMAASSPPSNAADKRLDKPNTPPSSPNINFGHREGCSEPTELQVDYWLNSGKSGESKSDGGGLGKKNDSGKATLKTCFKFLQVLKLNNGERPSPSFTINYAIKEKKQKIMRLGKKKEKEKDMEGKNLCLDGVSRLICSTKAQNVPISVSIDGKEWTGVKFFQLSPQWQTHLKYFPVCVFNGSADIMDS